MAEFVFGARTDSVSHIARPTLAAMPGLAEAVIQINGLFILSKIHMKCNLISVHHGGRHADREPGHVSSLVTVSTSLQSEFAADSQRSSMSFLGHLAFPMSAGLMQQQP